MSNATAEHVTSNTPTESPRRKPKKLRKGGGHSSVDEGSSFSTMAASSAESMAKQEEHTGKDSRPDLDTRDSDLPDLPIDENSFLNSDSSFIPSAEDVGDEVDLTADERAMRRHFADVESSFLPEPAPPPAQEEGRLGVDDTYLELGKPGHTPPPDEMFASLSGRKTLSHRRYASGSSAGKMPAVSTDEDEEEGMGTYGHASAENTTSSPAAAAARRGHGRNISATSSQRLFSGHARQISLESGNSRPTTPSSQRPTSKGSTIRPDFSPIQSPSAKQSTPKNAINGASVPSRFSSRSIYHRSASHYSSTMESDLSASDADNIDVALQTGGSLLNNSALGGSRRTDLAARLPSFASSYPDTESETAPSLSRDMGSSILARMQRNQQVGNDDENPETPRQRINRVEAPTDTAIAQHVQSIQVPETIARDFRARNRSLSPNKQRPSSSGALGTSNFQGVPRRTLTLKEQNSKIDKLTKENFDLKLKIHFLDQALQSRSEEGVKELIDKNVQLQTDLANERKEGQQMRRKMRELERKVKEQEESLAQAQAQQEQLQQQQRSSRDEDDDDPTLQAEMHEEILYLRQQLDHSENKVTTLSEEVLTKEYEKRKMAEHMRSMAGSRGEDTAGMKETIDMWQDLLNAETGRREQAEDDIRKLREELTALRIERASPAPNKIAKGRSRAGYEESIADSEYTNGFNGEESSAVLMEQLKHENAELRRDLGAQTSMLTSRNRERERLQQEIEDLKLLQRKSDGARSVAGDSIFDRSISRAHQRAPSRASDAPTQVTEAERDDWDKKEGQLRDQNAELRLKFQELERTHSTHLQYVSVIEGDFTQMETELNEAYEDLKALQTERDEALKAYDEKESELEKLEQEALAEIDKLEKEVETLQYQLEDSHKKQQRLQNKLEHTTDGYKGLQGELREITQSVMNLEDEKQANIRTIQTLEQQLAETEDELQKWEQKCKEIDQKNRKLEITQESLHSEITFLRDEQEGDKIKIGELEDSLNAAQQMIQDEQEKLREMEEGIVDERQQRDVLENQSKEEVQKVLDDLNNESQKTKDEVRKLRRALSAKEVEASSWKQRLEEYEQNLRKLIGDPEGSKQSLLADVEKLQRDLETTANSLDRAKMDLADKERLLRHRDGLLESTSLESRRLSDLLDKERASRRHDLEQFEKSSRGQASHMRTIAQQESKMLELEAVFTQDKRKMVALEEQYRDQLAERNTLLLALWNRLSTLCGNDWAQHHSLVDGELPSVDVISRRLPAFNKNLISAIKTVEALIGSFKIRIRNIEKDLWKDYQTLEHNLDIRIRRMDNLENAVHDTQKALAEEAQRPQPARSASGKILKSSEEISKLKSEVKILKSELKFHKQHPSALALQMINQQNQTNPDGTRRTSISAGSASMKSSNSPARYVAQLLRHHSSSAVEQVQSGVANLPANVQAAQERQKSIVVPSTPIPASEVRWHHRMKEMERRLKAEREGRLLDRKGARQRLEEGRLANEELRLALEHERERNGSSSRVQDLGHDEDDENSRAGSEMLGESDVNASSGVD